MVIIIEEGDDFEEKERMVGFEDRSNTRVKEIEVKLNWNPFLFVRYCLKIAVQKL